MSLLELTSAYAAVAGGKFPVVARGLPKAQPDEGITAFFQRRGMLQRRRDWTPMLDLLFAAANTGTGRRAALAVPTFGKTGTTQENRDAVFIGFAGDLIVGVWVGRDDNKSLGTMSGGTVPAQIWRNFMTSALAVDGHRSPSLPAEFRTPEPPPEPEESESPIPPEWSEGTRELREVARSIEQWLEEL
jgi:penicillin-binding protein 1A